MNNDFDVKLIEQTTDKICVEIIKKQNQILKGDLKMTKTNSISALRVGVLLVLVAVFSMFIFSACGGTTIEGTWKLDRVVSDGTTIKSTDTDKGEFGDDFNNVLTFNKDNTASIKIKSETAQNGTWKQTNSQITVTVSDKDTTYTLSGNELTSENGTVKYFYKKST